MPTGKPQSGIGRSGTSSIAPDNKKTNSPENIDKKVNFRLIQSHILD